METTRGMSNLQLELLKIFSFEVSEDQLLEIKSILIKYFSDNINKNVNLLFENNNWGHEKIEEWANEHMRTKYNEKSSS